MTRRLAATLAVAGACLVGNADAAPKSLAEVELTALAVAIEDGEGDYKVIDERMDETGTATALFGIVGGTINSAHNKSQDDETARRWREPADALPMGRLIEDAILGTLRDKSDLPIVASAEGASHTLLVDLDDWGLTRETQENDKLRAFVKATVRIEDARGRTVWKDHLSKKGKLSTADRDAFTDEVFTSELERLAFKTGRSIALEIVYR